MPPVTSTITLLTEILVTISILTVIYKGYRDGKFLGGLAFIALLYEIIFNISYMTHSATEHHTEITSSSKPLAYTLLAIFHGTFSLIMFLTLIVFMLTAAKRYKKGENYFKEKHKLTVTFVLLWLISIFSGALFYYATYF